MKIKQNLVGVLAVAACAFVAGRIDWGWSNTSMAEPLQQAGEFETTPKMEAMVKAGTPGKNHEYLNKLIGTWVGTFRMWMEPGAPAIVFGGTVTREWILDGRYIKETVESDGPMGSFRGLGFIGYNNIDGQYEFAWLENMSTAIMFGTGSYDADDKVMSFRGTHRDPLTGRVIYSTSKMDLSSPGLQRYVGYTIGPDGKKFKSFEGTMERQK